MDPNGLILLDKPEGMTSRAVDNALQRLFHTRKVGHLGTLDPFATGLLVVAIGKATKYLPFLPDEEKTYEATLVLGKKTDTGDYQGEIIEEKQVPELSKQSIENVLSSFLGESHQLPPMTSAIKKDGVPLYRLAHQGKEVERELRPIYIHQIRLLSFAHDEIRFEATVSKGTYIRTLGEDIAEKLGTVGFLSALRRTKVGPVEVKDALPLEKVDESALRVPSDFVFYPRVHLSGEQAKKGRNGVALDLPRGEERLLLLDETGIIAVYERQGSRYVCLRGLFDVA
ncbi:MAG: tRNA pseudouridine(55) synthase TruB [Bacilli bacterium]|nr:tRNA pseudouridine(55) synthase TruB [Bacilli bacterium]